MVDETNPPETEPTPEAATSEGAEDAVQALRSRLESLEADVESFKDQALRAQAEAENVRRRSAREVENAHKFALERFVADLLPVIDSLETAVQASRDLEQPGEGIGALIQGVELSLKLFHDTLAKCGVAQVDPEGTPFDPALHEAMSMLENDEVEPGTVLRVLQKGYTLHGRVVRAAKVMVAKTSAQRADQGKAGG